MWGWGWASREAPVLRIPPTALWGPPLRHSHSFSWVLFLNKTLLWNNFISTQKLQEEYQELPYTLHPNSLITTVNILPHSCTYATCARSVCVCVHVYPHIYICVIWAFRKQITDSTSLMHTYLSVYFLRTRTYTCITKVQLSKSANFTLMPSNDHANLWICSNFTNRPNSDLSQWRGGSRDPGSRPRSPFALTVSGAFSLNQLSVCLYPSWHWHFWGAQVWYLWHRMSLSVGLSNIYSPD